MRNCKRLGGRCVEQVYELSRPPKHCQKISVYGHPRIYSPGLCGEASTRSVSFQPQLDGFNRFVIQ
jgi:hypothetical protein